MTTTTTIDLVHFECTKMNSVRAELLEKLLASEEVLTFPPERMALVNEVLSALCTAVKHSDVVPGFLPAMADQIRTLSFRAYESVHVLHSGESISEGVSARLSGSAS